MVKRSIVRDIDVLTPGWRIEGTLIFVDQIHRDFRVRGEAVRPRYRQLGLTDEEIDAALAFRFPEVKEAQVEVELAAVRIQCVCGERRRTVITAPTYETDLCICGRSWKIPFSITANGHSAK